jgi:transposase
MSTSVGIDIAKELHWVCAIDGSGTSLLDRKLANTPEDLLRLASELGALPAPLRIGIDVLGGIASLTQAVLLEAGFELVHVSGLSVNRAREGTVGGESKSDPRDARVIADQVRTRRDLRRVEPHSELDIELRLLVSRRRDLTEDQTRRISRIHDLLASIFPEFEQSIDLTRKSTLMLLSALVTPAQLREPNTARLRKLFGPLHRRAYVTELISTAQACARRQPMQLPGETLSAELIRELARESLETLNRFAALDAQIEQRLAHHPDAALIRSLPGMGAVLTAELIAQAGPIHRFKSSDALAAAAGLAPILRQSGKMSFLRRANGGNKSLKRIFYQSAFASLRCPQSKLFYVRKRREGKHHHQAVIALARRRVNVLWAMLQNRQPFSPAPSSKSS